MKTTHVHIENYKGLRDIDRRREQLISEIEGKLNQRVTSSILFTIRWRLE